MGLALLRADHVEQDDWKGTTRCRAGRLDNTRNFSQRRNEHEH